MEAHTESLLAAALSRVRVRSAARSNCCDRSLAPWRRGGVEGAAGRLPRRKEKEGEGTIIRSTGRIHTGTLCHAKFCLPSITCLRPQRAATAAGGGGESG